MSCIRIISILLATVGISFPAVAGFGSERTYEVSASLTNGTGWAFTDGVKSGSGGVYFNRSGAAILSPEFDFAVTQVVVEVSATSTLRSLFVEPLGGDPYYIRQIPYDTSRARYEVGWDSAIALRRFEVVVRSGNSGSVYIHRITVRGAPLFPPPYSIVPMTVSPGACRLEWVNPPGTVSNTVVTYRSTVDAEGERTVQSYDFGFLVARGNPMPCRNELLETYPSLSGTEGLWYAATNMNGVLQLGNGENRGLLILPEEYDYDDMVLRLEAKRYEGDPTFLKLSTGWIHDGVTNRFEAVDLPQDGFGTVEIDVSAAAIGSRLVLNCDSQKTRRRLQLRSAALVRRNSEVETLAPVATNFFVVSSASLYDPTLVSCLIRGLAPETSYRFGVMAHSSRFSSPENSSERMDSGKLTGTCIRFR